MSRAVVITPAFMVPARVLYLEDCEVVCETCRGTGKVTVVYRDPGPNIDGPCMDCDGDGKRLKCTGCGKIQNHGVLLGKDRYRTLCLTCTLFAVKAERDAGHT